jgi:hypothetical protein
MKIQNVKSKLEFDITEDEWNDVFVAKGNDHKYIIVDEKMPIEIKQLKANKKEPIKLELKQKK